MKAELEELSKDEKQQSQLLNSSRDSQRDSRASGNISIRVRNPSKSSSKEKIKHGEACSYSMPARELLEQTLQDLEPQRLYLEFQSNNFSNLKAQDESSHGFFSERLFHLNTKKRMVFGIGDAPRYDFHERKSKEIRRLQFVAGLKLSGVKKSGHQSQRRSGSRFSNQHETLKPIVQPSEKLQPVKETSKVGKKNENFDSSKKRESSLQKKSLIEQLAT